MTSADTGTGAAALHLHSWRHPAILGAAGVSVLAGFSQFAATATLPDVAAAFGVPQASGASITARVGLSGTTLGLGLAVIRAASLAALPLAQLADTRSRRTTMLTVVGLGVTMTAVGAVSPSFWWFVALFALARPLLSAANAVSGVIAAEETTSAHRAKAIALVTASYGLGAGTPVVIRGLSNGAVGFRTVFALAAVGLLLLPVIARVVDEPERHELLRASDGDAAATRRARLGHVPPALRPRLARFALAMFLVTFVTGPANTYLFVFVERVLGVEPTLLAGVVPIGGLLGVCGLLAGRALADRVGRRSTSAAAHVGLALAGVATYTGGVAGAVAGYLATLTLGSVYAVSTGALGSEVFPTSVRATAAGWLTAAGTAGAVAGLVAFGAVGDALGSFGQAAAVLFLPITASALLYLGLPETMGLELEESAPEEPA